MKTQKLITIVITLMVTAGCSGLVLMPSPGVHERTVKNAGIEIAYVRNDIQPTGITENESQEIVLLEVVVEGSSPDIAGGEILDSTPMDRAFLTDYKGILLWAHPLHKGYVQWRAQ